MLPLYRQEALQAQKASSHGRIVMIQPPSLILLSGAALVFTSAVVLFFLFGSYTRHSTVSGQLLPDAGLIRIYSPATGVVLERRVREDQHVNPGDVLFVVSGERSIGAGNSNLDVSHGANASGGLLTSKSEELRRQLDILEQQIETQRSRLEISRRTVQSYQGLLQKRYVSSEQLEQKQGAYLEQKALLQNLEREQISLSHELDMQHLVITATQAGTATALTADVGQTVDTQKPLLSIVPENSKLHAELLAPSRAVGFLHAGDRVLLRYQSYPYQKFGHYGGAVTFVSRTSLTPNDASSYGQNTAIAEPLYEVRVTLDRQSVDAYGKQEPLRSGMALEADLLQERRRLYEWILDPLFSLSRQT